MRLLPLSRLVVPGGGSSNHDMNTFNCNNNYNKPGSNLHFPNSSGINQCHNGGNYGISNVTRRKPGPNTALKPLKEREEKGPRALKPIEMGFLGYGKERIGMNATKLAP